MSKRIAALEAELTIALRRLEFYAEVHDNDKLREENARMRKVLRQKGDAQ